MTLMTLITLVTIVFSSCNSAFLTIKPVFIHTDHFKELSVWRSTYIRDALNDWIFVIDSVRT